MVNSGSRKRTRKVSADVLDRLASREGDGSRARKASTRKVSGQVLDTLRDNAHGVPSAPRVPARTPGYGIIKRARVQTVDDAGTAEHARLSPPIPPDTGPTPGVDLRRAVDLSPPPLREPGTNPQFEIGSDTDEDDVVDGDITSPVSPAAMDAADFYVLSSPPPAQLRRDAARPVAAELEWSLFGDDEPDVQPEDLKAGPLAPRRQVPELQTHERHSPELQAPELQAPELPMPATARRDATPPDAEQVVADALARLLVRSPTAEPPVVAPVAAPRPIEAAPPAPLLPDVADAPVSLRKRRSFVARVRHFFSRIAALWRSSR